VHEETHFRVFKQDQMVRYRKMERAKFAAWYGAFIGNELVGDLGIIHDGELGRFQSVETHPAYRRKGIASGLIRSAASHALEQFGIRNLVMVADKGSPAERLYKSLGFEMTERQVSLERWEGST
jgi:GNAT superfamily N-acetyltransferase